MDEAAGEDRPLYDDGRDEKVVADAAEAVALEEGHEEAEADEDHHVDVLEHCETRREYSRKRHR